MIFSFSKERKSSTACLPSHLALTALVDTLERAELGDKCLPHRLQLGLGELLRHPGIELLRDVRRVAVLEVPEDGLGLRNRSIPGKLREDRGAEDYVKCDDRSKSDFVHGSITQLAAITSAQFDPGILHYWRVEADRPRPGASSVSL